MQQFRITEEGYKKFRKRWFSVIFPLALIPAALIIVTNIRKQGGDNTLLFVIPFIVLFLGFSVFRTLKKQKQMLMSYSVTISDSEIRREQLNSPPLSISFMEIKDITKTAKGGFIIRGIKRMDVINIPYWIDNPSELEQRLQALAPVVRGKEKNVLAQFRIPLLILCLVILCIIISKLLGGITPPPH